MGFFRARVLTIGVVILIGALVPQAQMVYVANFFGLPHFALAFIMADRSRMPMDPKTFLVFALAGGLTLWIGFSAFILTFALHVALNDAFFRGYEEPESRRWVRAMFYLGSLCAMICTTHGYLNPLPFWGLAGVSAILLGRHLREEWPVIGVVALSLITPLTFLHLFLYHFLLWNLVPRLDAKGARNLALAHGVCAGLFVLGFFWDARVLRLIDFMVIGLGWAHVVASFYLSSHHPRAPGLRAWIYRGLATTPGK